MIQAEGSVAAAQKFELRMISRKEQVERIKAELTTIKNDKFKCKAAEFLQWFNYQLDPPSLFSYVTPSDLKSYVSKARRYEGDLMSMVGDVNRKFRNLSPNKNLPVV